MNVENPNINYNISNDGPKIGFLEAFYGILFTVYFGHFKVRQHKKTGKDEGCPRPCILAVMKAHLLT